MRYRVHFIAVKKLRILPNSEIHLGIQPQKYFGWVEASDPDQVFAGIQECYERANIVKCVRDAQ